MSAAGEHQHIIVFVSRKSVWVAWGLLNVVIFQGFYQDIYVRTSSRYEYGYGHGHEHEHVAN